jgi:hypothetical protein
MEGFGVRIGRSVSQGNALLASYLFLLFEWFILDSWKKLMNN